MVACKIELARKTGEVVCKTEVPSPRQLERFRCMLQHENLVKGPLDMDAEDSGDSESDSTLQLPGAEENVENEFHDRLPETLVRNRADADAEKKLERVMARCLLWAGSPMNLWIMQKLLMRLKFLMGALKNSIKLSLDTKSVSKRKPQL